MTTLFPEEIKCAVCGDKSSQTMIGSSNSFGSMDLDTRPPEMMRSTISYWVQRCPSCGYCASNISEADADTAAIVNSAAYQSVTNNSEIPQLAASFQARSHELQHRSNLADAAWQAIHAAWICDDEKRVGLASQFRREAVTLIKKARINDQQVLDQPGAEELITVDLMRRSGMLREAKEMINDLTHSDFDEVIVKALEFEEELVKAEDVAAHNLSEALDGEAAGAN